uniref:Uncharacterized protein n=1 Tax=Schizaphis graminum TaxID=13262 RepID=A0A2S2P3C9_SCHGA
MNNNIMFRLLLYSSSNLKIKLFVLKNYTYFIIFLKMNKPAISKRSQLILQNTSSVVTKKAKYNRQLNFESIPKKLETDKVIDCSLTLSKGNLKKLEEIESFKIKNDLEKCEKWLYQFESTSTPLEEPYILKVHTPVLVQHHSIVQISSEVKYF